jgi:hypothetical protein
VRSFHVTCSLADSSQRVIGRNDHPPLCWMHAIDTRYDERDSDYSVTNNSPSVVQSQFGLFRVNYSLMPQ